MATKKEKIIEVIKAHYNDYIHKDDLKNDWESIEKILNNNVTFKGGEGYQFVINEKYSYGLSHITDEDARGAGECYTITSFLGQGYWYMAGRLMPIEAI